MLSWMSLLPLSEIFMPEGKCARCNEEIPPKNSEGHWLFSKAYKDSENPSQEGVDIGLLH